MPPAALPGAGLPAAARLYCIFFFAAIFFLYEIILSSCLYFFIMLIFDQSTSRRLRASFRRFRQFNAALKIVRF